MNSHMQVCHFPGCDHQFPDHRITSYCGGHSKRDVCVVATCFLHDPSLRPDIELVVDAVVARAQEQGNFNWAFVEGMSINIHDKRKERGTQDAHEAFWNLPRDDQQAVRLLVRRVVAVAKHHQLI